MQFSAFRVENYKSFRDSDWIEFGPGFNVIVGQNNSGKSALLEAMRLGRCPDKPFDDPARPQVAPWPQGIKQYARLSIAGSEFAYTLGRVNIGVYFPVPNPTITGNAVHDFLLDGSSVLSVTLSQISGQGWRAEKYPSHGMFQEDPQRKVAVYFPPQEGSPELKVVPEPQYTEGDNVVDIVAQIFGMTFFHFRAERLAVGSYQATEQTLLEPDASNLASLLVALQTQPRLWVKFNEHVRDIFPSISDVVVALRSSTMRIELIPPTKVGQREIKIPLSESGTGVGQVLAILYVAMTFTNACIIIDEPNSFLHPGAAKKLISILKLYHHNQYIISTHSSDLIAAADPSNVFFVEKVEAESTVRRIDRRELGEMRSVLAELGASLSDVFGCEQIVWVEGPTEVTCFPMILNHWGLKVPPGLSFIPLAGATDFDGSRPKAKKLMEVYERMAGSHALIPATVAFSLDREERQEEQRARLEAESNGKLKYLPRRLYENYLLDADAISAVLIDFGVQVSPEQVTAWLNQNRQRFGPPHGGADWLENGDGAKLLRALFDELSDATVEFRKTTHSPALTNWLLTNKPAELDELRDYLVNLLGLRM